MSPDQKLLQECLDVIKKLRHWTEPDYYREQVLPTVDRVKARLAVIETDRWVAEKQISQQAKNRLATLIENDFADTERSGLP